MRFPTVWYVRPAKHQISLRTCPVWSGPLLVARTSDKLLIQHHSVLLSLKGGGGCAGSSVSALVKMPHCWKSHVIDHCFCFMCYFCVSSSMKKSHWRNNIIKYVNILTDFIIFYVSCPTVKIPETAVFNYTKSCMTNTVSTKFFWILKCGFGSKLMAPYHWNLNKHRYTMSYMVHTAVPLVRSK